MSVPSVIFADASWYGSLRGGIAFGEGKDTRFADANSRWGIKGSNELSEGLSAIYRFEHFFNTENAQLKRNPNTNGENFGRLAYVGLSGGFGTLTLGQIWSASFNSTGAITDNSMIWGNSHTSYRNGNTLSYSNSVGNASLQVDAMMDHTRDTGDAVDQVEFGMTIGLGDIGKLAVGYVESKDTNMMTMVHKPAEEAMDMVPGNPEMYFLRVAGEDRTKDTPLMAITVLVPTGDTDPNSNGRQNPYLDDKGEFTKDSNGDGTADDPGQTAIVNAIRWMDGKHVFDTTSANEIDACEEDKDTAVADCKEITVYVQTVTTQSADSATANGNTQVVTSAPSTTYTYRMPEIGEDKDDLRVVAATPDTPATPYVPASTTSTADIKPGYKATHIAAEFGIGGVTAFLGHSKTENNGDAIMMGDNVNSMTGGVVDKDMMTKDSEIKVTHAGVRGSVGDGGINYLVQYRSVDDAGAKSSPFLIHLSQSLGEGASAHIEHANNDDGNSGKTWVGLKVDF